MLCFIYFKLTLNILMYYYFLLAFCILKFSNYICFNLILLMFILLPFDFRLSTFNFQLSTDNLSHMSGPPPTSHVKVG